MDKRMGYIADEREDWREAEERRKKWDGMELEGEGGGEERWEEKWKENVKKKLGWKWEENWKKMGRRK